MRLVQIAEEIIALLAADPHAAVKVRVPGQRAQIFPNHPKAQIVVAIQKIGPPFGCGTAHLDLLHHHGGNLRQRSRPIGWLLPLLQRSYLRPGTPVIDSQCPKLHQTSTFQFKQQAARRKILQATPSVHPFPLLAQIARNPFAAPVRIRINPALQPW